MLVYLLRHAVADEPDPAKYPDDGQRPLTADGEEKMRVAARGMARIIDRPDQILTSPLIRTTQTAKIAAAAFDGKNRVELCDLLRPGANAGILRPLLLTRASAGVERIMLVGHEPDMGQIASQLIGASGARVEFKKGALCAIEVDEAQIHQPGVLLWHLAPRLLRAIGEA